MPLSNDSLRAFIALYDTIEASLETVPSGPPPSAPARVKGTVRNFHASMDKLFALLESREPNAADIKDLSWGSNLSGQ